jgi:hypothetical protein
MTSRMLFELLGFLLSTNAKVKKMTTVSAIMFEIVEMYIFQTVACKQVQNFRPPRSFDFQLRLKINLRKQEKSFQRSD